MTENILLVCFVWLVGSNVSAQSATVKQSK